MLIYSPIENAIQRSDQPLQTAAVLDINEWILSGGEQVSGHNDVRTPEMHDAVAVGHGVRLPENLHSFIVVILPPAALKIRVARPSCRWGGRHLTGRCTHAVQHVVVRDDRRSNTGIAKRLCSG